MFDLSKPTYVQAVRNLVGGDVVSIGPGFDEIEYRDGQKPPTKKATEDELKKLLKEWENKKYFRKRQEKYDDNKIDHHNLIIALWEKVVEGREEFANELQDKRLKIKKDIPK